jgi:pyrrolidone-carboxylate peptidase
MYGHPDLPLLADVLLSLLLRICPVVQCHFGVHGGSRCFNLERVAFNEATFAAPDQRGEQPVRERVTDSGPAGLNDSAAALGQPLLTTIDLDALQTALKAKGKEAGGGLSAGAQNALSTVKISCDAGRFLCNFI